MWNRSGRSLALDRAEALLSVKKRRGDEQSSTLDCTDKTRGSLVGSFKVRSPPHTLFSDVPDLSSGDTASEHRANDDRAAGAKKKHGTEMETSKDVRPQSSLGGGSRFLKKAPKPTSSSQSLVSRNQTHQRPEPRYSSSFKSGSQAAAISRLSEIEKRVNSRKQAIEDTRQASKAAPNLTSDLNVSVTAVDTVRSTEASEQLLSHSSSEQSQKKKHFLKKKAAGAAVAPIISDVSGRSRPRTTDPLGLKLKSARVTSGVNLDSDEEDMKKLLGDSMDSTDYTTSGPKKTSSIKRLKKEENSPSQRVQSPAPPTAVHPSSPPNTPTPPSAASPPHRSSPFRFTGQAQVHFSPSVLSPSPSPPRVSPSHSERVGSPHRAGSPQEAPLSLSKQAEVFSLEELIPPVRPASEDQHSPTGSVSSEDFKINIMTIDELLPASAGFTTETLGNKQPSQSPSKHVSLVPETQHVHQQEEEEQQQGEDVLDYRSDFESDSSIRQVSEHMQGEADEDEVLTEAPSSDGSHEQTEDNYSHTFFDRSCSCTSQTSDLSQRSNSASRGSRSSHHLSRTQTLSRKALKDAATQTQPAPLAGSQSAGAFTLDLALSRLYMNPPPVVTHTVSAERLEAMSSFSPVVFALNELLKQQLNTTRQFINHSDHLHSCLLRGLEPPNYRYTTLEDTIQNIRQHRTPKI